MNSDDLPRALRAAFEPIMQTLQTNMDLQRQALVQGLDKQHQALMEGMDKQLDQQRQALMEGMDKQLDQQRQALMEGMDKQHEDLMKRLDTRSKTELEEHKMMMDVFEAQKTAMERITTRLTQETTHTPASRRTPSPPRQYQDMSKDQATTQILIDQEEFERQIQILVKREESKDAQKATETHPEPEPQGRKHKKQSGTGSAWSAKDHKTAAGEYPRPQSSVVRRRQSK